MFELDTLLRNNIRNLVPYSSARDEFKGSSGIFLDANENSMGAPLNNGMDRLNRYPDPLQAGLKKKISEIKGVPVGNIFLGNGSDEAIDILYRAFCNPGKDNVILAPPTYGMYEVSARVNDVEVREVPLTTDFQLDLEGIARSLSSLEGDTEGRTKLIFLCSPNNPTGNSLDRKDIEVILNNFNGVVVVDEAYINFSKQKSFVYELNEYPNLVILQTFSKAWGMAGLRIGMAFASEEIIAVMNKIKPPYNINEASQHLALKALENMEQVNSWIKAIVAERENLASQLGAMKMVKRIFPSDANFLLVKTEDAGNLYQYLVSKGIVVRDRSKITGCEGCLRITVGTQEENKKLMAVLNSYK